METNISLRDRMKDYENKSEFEIQPTQHIICRIDGHKFSKFTKDFNKPFDDILSEVFELTCKDLLVEFGAITVYQQSDEITLVIPSLISDDNPNWKHNYSGRVQKMSSLISAFTTMKFNKYLSEITKEKITTAWFDCRTYGVNSNEEVFNSVIFRFRDCIKNSRSVHAQTYCTHKELHKLNSKEQSEYTLNKSGEDWNKINPRYKYGLFIKKESYTKEQVKRTRIVTIIKEELIFSKEGISFIMNKRINE